jgi:Peptidase C10 family/Spi protease inhibitor
MQNFKSLLSIVAVSYMAIFLFSCRKDSEKARDETKAAQQTQVQSREKSSSLFGNDHVVPTYVARSVAEKINLTVSEAMRVGTSTSVRSVDSLFTISDSLGTPVMYIANYAGDGYVVISADDRHEPVCALVEQGRYEAAEVPSMLLEWFDITFENILLVRSGAINSSQFADGEWVRVIKNIGKEEYLVIEDCCPECPNYPECLSHPAIGCGEPDIFCQGGGGGDPCAPQTTTTKGPLMTTKWNQGCTYNEQCPDKDCDDVCYSNENAWTGCVATAMAQILRYWAHSCSQNYNYTTMPNNSGNSEVQRMMKDVGDAVDMDYGCDGSGADGDKTDNAFKDDFCFSSATRSGYGSGSYQTVVQNIDANRPVLLDGCRTRKKHFFGLWYTYSNCHMWVCDGYERHQNSCYSILKFHMNWGWGPDGGNGWFYYNSWNSSLGNYQYAQDFTHNIHP